MFAVPHAVEHAGAAESASCENFDKSYDKLKFDPRGEKNKADHSVCLAF